MSWIQQNSFVAKLAGVTLVGTIGLLGVGQYFRSNYQHSLDQVRTNTETIAKGQSLPFYPNEENLTAKESSIRNYGETVEQLTKSFDEFRPKGAATSPQQFADDIKTANEKVLAAFAEAKVVVPPAFFMGFETYKAGLASPLAAPILDRELNALTEMYLHAASAGISEIKNVSREKLPEENGTTVDDQKSPYRALPVEFVFRGSEESFRKLLSSLASSKTNFYVVSTLRVKNDREVAPKQDDVKFEQTQPTVAAESQASFFDASAGGEQAAPPAQAVRKLKDVAGKEQVTVFLKVNILQFAPKK